MCARHLIPVFFFCAAVTRLYAVSGFGVAARMDGSKGNTFSMRLYKVTNNHVDTSYDIHTAQDFFGPAVINTHGTHVAFMRATGTWAAPDQRLAVMRLSDPSKFAELARFGNDTLNGSAGQLAWPQGDWIYFTTATTCRYLYRVNAQTREIQFVAFLNFDPNGSFGAELKMSAVNYRMSVAGGLYFTLQQAQAAPHGVLNTGQWPNGTFTIQGCGHTISPSGTIMGNQVDPGHYCRITTPLDWGTRTVGSANLNWPKTRNRWSLDKTDTVLACSLHVDPSTGSDTGFTESIGVGDATYGNAFSVNSDRWECLISGWSPGGREQGNGGNVIVWNLKDSICFNLTRLPRRNDPAGKPVEAQCHVDPNYFTASAPSFFVTAPVDEILSELRADATMDYKVPGLDDNTVFPALTMMPQTPAGGFPIVPLGIGGPAIRPTGGAALAGVTCGSSWIRLAFSSAPQPYRVTIFDPRGSVVAQRCGAARVETFTSRDGIRAGLHLVRVEWQGRVATATVTVP